MVVSLASILPLILSEFSLSVLAWRDSVEKFEYKHFFFIYNKNCSKYKCTQTHKNSHIDMGIIQTARTNSKLSEGRRDRERERSRQRSCV